jgi:hypothetical protein
MLHFAIINKPKNNKFIAKDGIAGWVLAEGEGFEPTMDFSIPVFKTGALSHSAIPPFENNPPQAHGILPYPG